LAVFFFLGLDPTILIISLSILRFTGKNTSENKYSYAPSALYSDRRPVASAEMAMEEVVQLDRSPVEGACDTMKTNVGWLL
jgi:hypothetical protein